MSRTTYCRVLSFSAERNLSSSSSIHLVILHPTNSMRPLSLNQPRELVPKVSDILIQKATDLMGVFAEILHNKWRSLGYYSPVSKEPIKRRNHKDEPYRAAGSMGSGQMGQSGNESSEDIPLSQIACISKVNGGTDLQDEDPRNTFCCWVLLHASVV